MCSSELNDALIDNFYSLVIVVIHENDILARKPSKPINTFAVFTPGLSIAYPPSKTKCVGNRKLAMTSPILR